MKEGWTYKKLGEVCETLNGLWKGKKPPFVNVGVIRNANFTKDFTLRYDNVEYLDVEEKQYVKRKLQRGDLIIEKSGGSEKQPVGRAVLFDKENGEFSFSNFTSVLRVKNGILQSRFLYIYLLFIYKRGDTLKMQKATTGIHNIEFDKYLNIDIPILPFAQQQRIVSHLDAAFAHIDALKANAEKQLAEARQLFQAELAECMRPKEGWEEKKIKDVGEVIGGTTPSTSNSEFWGGDICWISPAELHGEHYLYDSVKKITPKAVAAKSLKELPEGTVILSSRAPIGKIAINKVPMYCNQGFKCVVCGPELFNEYLYWWFYGKKDYLNSLGTGATFPEISKTVVEDIVIPIAPMNEQQSIVSRLDALSANIKKLEELQRKTLAECDALKQAMLREVFE